MLRESVARLAADAPAQRRYLERLGVAPSADELALEIDDVLASVVDALPEATQRLLRQLDAMLDALSAQDLWTTDALVTRPEWADVRRLAQSVLASWPEHSG